MAYLKFLFIVAALFVASSVQAVTSWESLCFKKDFTVDIWSNNCIQTKVCHTGYAFDFFRKDSAVVTSNVPGGCNRGTWNESWKYDTNDKYWLVYGGAYYEGKKDDAMAKKHGASNCYSAFVTNANIVC